MPRPKKLVPEKTYHVSGQDRVYLDGRYYYLGPSGTPEEVLAFFRTGQSYSGWFRRTIPMPQSGSNDGSQPVTQKRRRFTKEFKEEAVQMPCGQKTQPSVRLCEKETFMRFTGYISAEPTFMSTSAMFPQSFGPERRQALIAHSIGHAALHFASYQ